MIVINNKRETNSGSLLYKANTNLLSFNKRKIQEEDTKWNNLEKQAPLIHKCKWINKDNKRSLALVEQVFDSLSEEENDGIMNTDFRNFSIHPESTFMLIINILLIFSFL